MKNIWLSEVFRLTAFLQDDDVDFSSWWSQITGEEPSNRNSQPKIKVFQDEGPYAGGHLVMGKQPGRVDWLFFPSFDLQLGVPDYRELLPFEKGQEVFNEIAKRWLEISPELKRIAFGTILNHPVDNRTMGYSELSTYLPDVIIDTENSSDFIYQINRRRPSKVIEGLVINRLSKWLVAIVEINRISIAPVNDLPNLKDKRYFSRVELDINTIQTYQNVLPKEKYYNIYNELVDLAVEIKEKGDVK